MSSVEFEEDFKNTVSERIITRDPQKKSFTTVLISHGIAPNEVSANTILIMLACIFFMLAGFVFFYTQKNINANKNKIDAYQNIDQTQLSQVSQ